MALYAAGEAAGLLYYTMPYMEGETLRRRLDRDGALPVRAAVRLVRELADALASAHAPAATWRSVLRARSTQYIPVYTVAI